MRLITISLLLSIPLTGCFRAAPTGVTVAEIPQPPGDFIRPSVPRTESVLSFPYSTHCEFSGITFEGVSFDSRSHRLVVVDQAKGPASQFSDAAAAGNSCKGIAATNGGFFTPEGKPLGLVVAAGHASGNWNSASSLGSGVWYEKPSGEIAISRREQLGRSGAGAMRELMQSGPLLVENQRPVVGLEATKSSARTVILWDGEMRWWLGRSSPCTLAELANAIAKGQPAGWEVRFALNLDGGRSADLWISEQVPGGPLVRRPLWNRAVRNFLVLVPK